MKGIHQITISNASVRYEFSLKRNITVIRGDSATGKTTLVEMINEYYESGQESGIELRCDKQCRVLGGRDWKTLLPTIRDSIVFIDEDNEFLPTDEFARAVRESDNYYCLITREGLPNLPYSVEEIYGIRTSGKYAGLRQVYHEFYHIYGDHRPHEVVRPEEIIVEDSNSGYEFFDGISKDKDYTVVSAEGKSKIFSKANEVLDKRVVIIADGAAFGPEIDRLMKLCSKNNNIIMFLPESFEWLILSAGIIQDGEIREILNNPSGYIESSENFSWERFFTKTLISKSQGSYLKYKKDHLNPAYLSENIVKKVLSRVEDIEL